MIACMQGRHVDQCIRDECAKYYPHRTLELVEAEQRRGRFINLSFGGRSTSAASSISTFDHKTDHNDRHAE
jgi:hypothetical protein